MERKYSLFLSLEVSDSKSRKLVGKTIPKKTSSAALRKESVDVLSDISRSRPNERRSKPLPVTFDSFATGYGKHTLGENVAQKWRVQNDSAQGRRGKCAPTDLSDSIHENGRKGQQEAFFAKQLSCSTHRR